LEEGAGTSGVPEDFEGEKWPEKKKGERRKQIVKVGAGRVAKGFGETRHVWAEGAEVRGRSTSLRGKGVRMSKTGMGKNSQVQIGANDGKLQKKEERSCPAGKAGGLTLLRKRRCPASRFREVKVTKAGEDWAVDLARKDEN